MQQVKEDYRGYTIIAAVLKASPAAQIYSGKTRIGGIRFEGDSLDEVVAEARSWIDGKLGADAEKQRAAHIATTERYREFLNVEKLGDHEVAMLVAHARARVLTAGELANAAGWDSFSSANAHYGFLGRKAAAFLGLELPTHSDGSPAFTYALAESAGEGGQAETGNFQWAIHPELAKAVVDAGLLNAEPDWMVDCLDQIS